MLVMLFHLLMIIQQLAQVYQFVYCCWLGSLVQECCP